MTRKKDLVFIIFVVLIALSSWILWFNIDRPWEDRLKYEMDQQALTIKNCVWSGTNLWKAQNLTIKVWGKVTLPQGYRMTFDGNNRTSILNFIEKMALYGGIVKVENS